MMVSPPSSPDGGRMRPPSSIYSAYSPEAFQKQRPIGTLRHARSGSRISRSSSRAGTRISDEEGKTSVKVVVRVRPPLGPSDPGFDLIPQRFQRSMVQVNTNTSLGVDSPQGRKIFVFDRVLDADTSQKGVWDYLEDSVDSFLQGYNVSLLAYGQSGSGKSYTMGTSGPAQQFDPSARGVIPRAASHLFETLGETTRPNHARQTSGFISPSRYSVANVNPHAANAKTAQAPEGHWDMSVTYVEIYNEHPRDLLLPEAQPLHERPTVQIREDQKGRIFVEGLKVVGVNSIEELMAVLNHGSSIRQTDATAINSKSSRSHAIFTINLRQTRSSGTTSPTKDKTASGASDNLSAPDNLITIESKLHFVDLAGSERLKNTGATGDRAKEGISINAGLASLGKVISQLSSRASGGHISYRDSKLTRILQDSLGGNAITYMIACVTPAEFHLSETLNTVQYAQRARNIQSKPKIQQVNDDSDKQSVIDRLRSEVAFLRQQIRSSETGERRNGNGSEQPHEREIELQTQLLDIQESYNALSNRHSKLISELTSSSEIPQHQAETIAGESAVDRLKRSQANQQQIDQFVLELEKTIQSLETNLQTTRMALANTESNLLERETKCAYVETMNQQLNTRVQKLIDRESNTETYLKELEARLEDQSSGSEKNDAIIAELRKEMARIRENESNAEDYICTLEERLAEADQDMEIMQREMERMEQLVERQRSLGKLDNLLYELDRTQQKRKSQEITEIPRKEVPKPNGIQTKESLKALPEGEEVNSGTQESPESDAAERLSEADVNEIEAMQKARDLSVMGEKSEEPEPSPEQQKFVAEHFETVTQELFDLKIEHESTISELDLIQAKYQEALRTLAKMQDSFDETRHGQSRSPSSMDQSSRPISYFEDTRIHELKSGERPSTRSLSSELSSVDETPVSAEHDATRSELSHDVKESHTPSETTEEITRLQTLLAEHEKNLAAANEQYSQLQIDHSDALKTVDKLKSEVARSRYDRPASPSMPGMIRRMTSNVGSGVDRGQRSIISLRTLLADELDNKPEQLEGAEVHLSAANAELQSRMERIQSLENEVKNIKKEMDMKSTIISGLTRERNSVRAGTPVDLNMVSQLRDQLIQKETELKSLHEGYAAREHELQSEITRLSAIELRSPTDSLMPKSPVESVLNKNDEEVQRLRDEIVEISKKNETAEKSVQDSEKKLTVTIAELEAARISLEALKTHQARSEGEANKEIDAVAATQSKYEEAVGQLKRDLEEQVALNVANAEKISQLTQAHSTTTKELEEHQQSIKARSGEIEEHKAKIGNLQTKIKEAESAVEFHKHGLKSLHETHANEIEEMKLSHAGILASYDDKMAEMVELHTKEIDSHQSEAQSSKGAIQALIASAQRALGHPTSHDMLSNHIQDLADEKRHISETNTRLVNTNAELERQLAGRQSLEELEEAVEQASQRLSNYQETIRSLANEIGNHEETIRAKEMVIKKHEASIQNLESENQKKVSMIEELEQQLQNSFEQHHNRVSVIQAQGNQALVDAQNRIATLEKEVQRTSMAGSDDASRTNTMKSHARPQSPAQEQRSNSMTSNLRKSGSHASLPSPPPAIPLPPLPNLPSISVAQSSNPSPPASRHASKEVAQSTTPNPTTSPRESHAAGRQSAIIEEQEGRLRTIEKHLHAEKQLTATLEEALVDLETQSNKLRVDAESWKKKAWAMEEELASIRRERRTERLSVQAVEEEVKKRREAEAARAQLEERMRLLQQSDGKKKRKTATLNCF